MYFTALLSTSLRPAVCDVPGSSSAVAFRSTFPSLSPLSFSICIWHVGSLWCWKSSTEKKPQQTSVPSLPPRANWYDGLRICAGPWGQCKMTRHWFREACDAAASTQVTTVCLQCLLQKSLWLIFDFCLFGTRHSKGKCHTMIRGFDSQYFKEIFVVDFCQAVSAVWAHTENLMMWVWWCVTHRGLTDLTTVDTAVSGAYVTQCKAECSHSISRNWQEKWKFDCFFVEVIDYHCNMETRK